MVPENRQRALSEMPARDPPTSRQGAVQPDGGGMMYSPRRDDPAYSGAPQPQVVNERQLRQPWSSSADVATDARQPSEEREQQRASPGRVAAAPYSGFVPITPPEGKQRRQKPPQIPRRLQANNARPIGRQQAPLPPVAGSRRAPPPESAPEPWSDVGPDEPASDNPYYDGAQFTGEPYGPGGFIDVCSVHVPVVQHSLHSTLVFTSTYFLSI